MAESRREQSERGTGRGKNPAKEESNIRLARGTIRLLCTRFHDRRAGVITNMERTEVMSKTDGATEMGETGN